jgi:hypothetical protein
VSTPYTYTPVGQRVYYFVADPNWFASTATWNRFTDYLPSGWIEVGWRARDPYQLDLPKPSAFASVDAPGYGVVQPDAGNGYGGVTVSPPVRGLTPGMSLVWTLTGTQLTGPWALETVCAYPLTISMAPQSAQLSTVSPGNTIQFSATNRDANGNVITCRPFVWGTGDYKIATVDANGLVTGHAPGTTVVSVGSPGYIAAVATITVRSPKYVASGFDYARGGEKSLAQGSYLGGFRASIAGSYPDVEFAGFGTLSSAALSGVDVVVLSALRNNDFPISPLTPEEQAALRGFVERGGCAMLFAENSENASSSNPGLLNPFGVTIAGILQSYQTATVIDPSASLVTSGPFGTITSFGQNYPGGITTAGPNGVVLATNALGAALVVIPRGALGAGSGPVVIFSDATMLSSGPEGMFQSNEALFMNAFAFCRG